MLLPQPGLVLNETEGFLVFVVHYWLMFFGQVLRKSEGVVLVEGYLGFYVKYHQRNFPTGITNNMHNFTLALKSLTTVHQLELIEIQLAIFTHKEAFNFKN